MRYSTYKRKDLMEELGKFVLQYPQFSLETRLSGKIQILKGVETVIEFSYCKLVKSICSETHKKILPFLITDVSKTVST